MSMRAMFAPTAPGPLFSRLRFLALDALCIGVGAGLGYFARNHASRWGSVWRR
jgi:hypothetical protein